MGTRTLFLGLVGILVASGCGARSADAGGRGVRMSASDRGADGWTRTSAREGVAAKPAEQKPAAAKSVAAKPAATPQPKKVAMLTPPSASLKPDFREKAVSNGRAILAGNAPKPKREDCSGFVTAIYERAGHSLEISPDAQRGTRSMAEMLYRTAKADGRTHSGAPRPGDLAFYRDTYGKMDGRITHVAVVESIQEDGTVMVLHNIGGRYRRSPMNLAKPHEPLKNGFFRKKGSANEPVLAGELFVAYARPS